MNPDDHVDGWQFMSGVTRAAAMGDQRLEHLQLFVVLHVSQLELANAIIFLLLLLPEQFVELSVLLQLLVLLQNDQLEILVVSFHLIVIVSLLQLSFVIGRSKCDSKVSHV